MAEFDYLKDAIRQTGYTLQQVADASEMTKGYLSQLINNKIKSPSAQKIAALHRFLGLEYPQKRKWSEWFLVNFILYIRAIFI